jgi:hypothetical protein
MKNVRKAVRQTVRVLWQEIYMIGQKSLTKSGEADGQIMIAKRQGHDEFAPKSNEFRTSVYYNCYPIGVARSNLLPLT